MFKKIGSVLATLLGLLLLVYSATRSIDFISLTLPADRQILAWFGLAALDGGLVCWLLSYLYGSRGWQRAIALCLVLVDFVGAVAMFTADTLYNSGQAGMTARLTESEMYTLILVLSIIIAINIAATVLHHLLDPDTMRRQAEEEAESEIEDHTLELVKKGAKVLAAKTAPQLAAAWVGELEARYASVIVASKTRTKKATEGITAQLPPDSGTDQSTLPLMASTVPLNPTNRRKS